MQEDRTVSNKTIIKLCSVAAFILLVGLALGPSKMVPRSGLGWEFDHFFGYFALTLIACLVWPRPLVIGAAFVVLAALLEGLQAFTPDRTPDLGLGIVQRSRDHFGGFQW